HEFRQIVDHTPDLSSLTTPQERLDAVIRLLTLTHADALNHVADQEGLSPTEVAHLRPDDPRYRDLYQRAGQYLTANILYAVFTDRAGTGYGSIFRVHPQTHDGSVRTARQMCPAAPMVAAYLEGVGLTLRQDRESVLNVMKTWTVARAAQPADLQQKQASWEAKRREADHIVDALGLGIDEGIKEAVVAFNLLGLNTTASCEGHTDHGLLTPWIDVAAPHKPKLQYIDEMQVFQKVADRYGIPLGEFRRGVHRDGYWEARREAAGNGETAEFKTWRQQSDVLGRRVEEYLREFYADQKTAENVRLRTSWSSDDICRVWCGDIEEHYPREQTVPEGHR
ncbi:MAG: hypothetical protein ACREMY_33585, partial [bacterium]